MLYVARANTPELPQGEKPESIFFAIELPEATWLSVVNGDEELEYAMDGTTLRVRLDWGNQWSGGEMLAHQLITADQPFALVLRTGRGEQRYFPSVTNISPSRGFNELE